MKTSNRIFDFLSSIWSIKGSPCNKPFILVSKFPAHQRWFTNNHNILGCQRKPRCTGRFLFTWCTVHPSVGGWWICVCWLAFPSCPWGPWSFCCKKTKQDELFIGAKATLYHVYIKGLFKVYTEIRWWILIILTGGNQMTWHSQGSSKEWARLCCLLGLNNRGAYK